MPFSNCILRSSPMYFACSAGESSGIGARQTCSFAFCCADFCTFYYARKWWHDFSYLSVTLKETSYIIFCTDLCKERDQFLIASQLASHASKKRKTFTAFLYILLFLFLVKEMASLAKSLQTLDLIRLRPANAYQFSWQSLVMLATH